MRGLLARTPPRRGAHAGIGRLQRAASVSVCAVVAWSLFELPWEIGANSSREQIWAVLASKTILLLIAVLALRGMRAARFLMLFVCLTGVLASAPEVSTEFSRMPWLALLAGVECIAKIVAFVLLALHLDATSRTKTRSIAM